MARDRINDWTGLPYFNPTEVLREAYVPSETSVLRTSSNEITTSF